MINTLRNCCLSLSNHRSSSVSDALGRQDGLLWNKDLGKHVYGEFSAAVIQANNLLEDQSQVESGSLSLLNSGPFGTFVGVYDGHGGPEAARYVCDHLFNHIKKFATDLKTMSEEVLRKAIESTEDGFMSIVSDEWTVNPQIAAVGSCCLVGVVCDGTIFVANLGDSRAVLGRMMRTTGEILALQLSPEHNASIESVRNELRSLHPEDPQIVALKLNVWRVKGIIQVSRSIGDAYLKKPEFNRKPLYVKFRLKETFTKPILSAEPSISVQPLHPDDKFLILASDGLWEHISNERAVRIVQNNPRKGIAWRLVVAAVKEAAKKREIRYSDLNKIGPGVRRYFHDDITVIVLYLAPHDVSQASTVSLRGGEIALPSNCVSIADYGAH